ncbi:hypothetical protein CPC08DRAFT_423338 [Agrocybe pediades]|nr:hypothetical protein CPC08DRAFT_423338 [Agrocybe pediades]
MHDALLKRKTSVNRRPFGSQSPDFPVKRSSRKCAFRHYCQQTRISALHRFSPSHSQPIIKILRDTCHLPHTTTRCYTRVSLKPELVVVHALQNKAHSSSDTLTLLHTWANQQGYSEGTKACVRGFEGAGPG